MLSNWSNIVKILMDDNWATGESAMQLAEVRQGRSQEHRDVVLLLGSADAVRRHPDKVRRDLVACYQDNSALIIGFFA